MSRQQYSTYGLPSYVLTFLHHMETHKDRLKWNIVEGSHKLTLTLTWNFRKNKTKETLWEKLQRTIKLGRSSGDARDDTESAATVPRNVRGFIKRTAEERPEVRPYKATVVDESWNSQRSRQQSHHWSKLSSQSLPGKLATGGANQPLMRNSNSSSSRHHFISSYSSYHNLPSRLSRPGEISPFHSSWPGASFDASSEAVEHSTPTATTPDMTSRSMQPSPSSTNRQSSIGCYRDNSTSCSKTGDDDYLADDVTEECSDFGAVGSSLAPSAASIIPNITGTKKHTSVSPAETDAWPRLRLELLDETGVTSKLRTTEGIGRMADMELELDSAAEAGDGRMVNETVLKCLDSCDKILFRHSTTIT